MMCNHKFVKWRPCSTAQNIMKCFVGVERQTMCITDCECDCVYVSVWVNECCVKPQKLELRISGPLYRCGKVPRNADHEQATPSGLCWWDRERNIPCHSAQLPFYMSHSPYTSPICPVLYSVCFQIFDISYTTLWQTNTPGLDLGIQNMNLKNHPKTGH